MNAGMYGMSDGRGMAERKVIAAAQSPGTSQLTAVTASTCANSLGYNAWLNGTTITLNTRTRILSVNGKGALRLHVLSGDAAGSTNAQQELWVDGVKVKDHSVTSLQPTNSAVLVGAVSTAGVTALDYVPFNSSLEIWVSVNATRTAMSAATVYDLHQ